MSSPTANAADESIDLGRLRAWNLGLTLLHAVQAALVAWLATDFAITVTQSLPTGPPGTPLTEPESLLDVRIGWAVAGFLALAALDHLLTATVLRGRYERGLAAGINRFRWVEYSLSATVMVILIGMYAGITGLEAILGIAGANVAMILFGWLQEESNPPDRERTTMRPFWFGCVAGATPWVVIGVNLVSADEVPGFVVGIFVSLFVFFNSFALNQWLQYRRVGPWRRYGFGEKAYLVLSLAAKSALAWQIFGGSLAG